MIAESRRRQLVFQHIRAEVQVLHPIEKARTAQKAAQDYEHRQMDKFGEPQARHPFALKANRLAASAISAVRV